MPNPFQALMQFGRKAMPAMGGFARQALPAVRRGFGEGGTFGEVSQHLIGQRANVGNFLPRAAKFVAGVPRDESVMAHPFKAMSRALFTPNYPYLARAPVGPNTNTWSGALQGLRQPMVNPNARSFDALRAGLNKAMHWAPLGGLGWAGYRAGQKINSLSDDMANTITAPLDRIDPRTGRPRFELTSDERDNIRDSIHEYGTKPALWGMFGIKHRPTGGAKSFIARAAQMTGEELGPDALRYGIKQYGQEHPYEMLAEDAVRSTYPVGAGATKLKNWWVGDAQRPPFEKTFGKNLINAFRQSPQYIDPRRKVQAAGLTQVGQRMDAFDRLLAARAQNIDPNELTDVISGLQNRTEQLRGLPFVQSADSSLAAMLPDFDDPKYQGMSLPEIVKELGGSYGGMATELQKRLGSAAGDLGRRAGEWWGGQSPLAPEQPFKQRPLQPQ